MYPHTVHSSIWRKNQFFNHTKQFFAIIKYSYLYRISLQEPLFLKNPSPEKIQSLQSETTVISWFVFCQLFNPTTCIGALASGGQVTTLTTACPRPAFSRWLGRQPYEISYRTGIGDCSRPSEDWQAQSQVTMAIKPGHMLHYLQSASWRWWGCCSRFRKVSSRGVHILFL